MIPDKDLDRGYYRSELSTVAKYIYPRFHSDWWSLGWELMLFVALDSRQGFFTSWHLNGKCWFIIKYGRCWQPIVGFTWEFEWCFGFYYLVKWKYLIKVGRILLLLEQIDVKLFSFENIQSKIFSWALKVIKIIWIYRVGF